MIIQKADAAVPLVLTVDRASLGGVTGLSPTVAILNASTTGSYFDWSDGTFKTLGWVTKYKVMTELERGSYRAILNAVASTGIVVGQYLMAMYHVDDGGSNKGDSNDEIEVVEWTSLLNTIFIEVEENEFTVEGA